MPAIYSSFGWRKPAGSVYNTDKSDHFRLSVVAILKVIADNQTQRSQWNCLDFKSDMIWHVSKYKWSKN